MGAGWDGSLANRKTSDLEALLQLYAGSTAQRVLDPHKKHNSPFVASPREPS